MNWNEVGKIGMDTKLLQFQSYETTEVDSPTHPYVLNMASNPRQTWWNHKHGQREGLVLLVLLV